MSMVSTPFLMRIGERLAHTGSAGGVELDGPDVSPESKAVVVGYGRFGQTVAQMLMGKRVAITIIDIKPEQIELSEQFGTKVYYGDGTRIDLLRTAGAQTAEAILFCQDPHALTRSELAAVLEAFPQASVLVRVYDRRQLVEFDGLDVHLFQRELFESAVVMGRHALLAVGVSEHEVKRLETEYRRLDDERLQRQSGSGDLYAAKDQMFSRAHALADEPGPEAS
jgi:voltage-gated potassium channel Kch